MSVPINPSDYPLSIIQIALAPLETPFSTIMPRKNALAKKGLWYGFKKAVERSENASLIEMYQNGLRRRVTLEQLEGDNVRISFVSRLVDDEWDLALLASGGIVPQNLVEDVSEVIEEEIKTQAPDSSIYRTGVMAPQTSEASIIPETSVDLMYSTMPKEYTSPSVGPKRYTKEEVEAKGVRILDN